MVSTPDPQHTSSISATSSVVQVRSWLLPLIAAGVLAVLGVSTNRTLLKATKANLEEELTTILNADVAALRLWLENHRLTAGHFAADPRITETAEDLVMRARQTQGGVESLLESVEAKRFAEILDDVVQSFSYVGYFVVDATSRPLAAQFQESVGEPAATDLMGYVRQVFNGDTVVTRPVHTAQPSLPDATVNRGDRSVMFVGAPIIGRTNEVIAILAFGIAPEEDFTRILSVARLGRSGETYAFDEDGLMISDTRFGGDLFRIGLLPDSMDSSVLQVNLRDPGGNLVAGYRPNTAPSDWPLTRMAASATAGDDGINVLGYRDYRGVDVVGAWTWLPEFGFGVTTEVDVSEAFRTFHVLQNGLWILLALLVAVSGGILVSSHLIGKLRRDVTEAEQLGQYRLEEKIGEGGMGQVYRASHALLRRPTAIKLLRADRTGPQSLRRFEREVQLTSQLAHPNTVAIYDYGRTPDGVFYYAMEYLDGITLSTLVGRYGPQPQARVVHILKQACGSLAEAHAAGIIHRDIKPSNLMLCDRGGAKDVVKLLDFGLVRELETSASDENLTGTTALTGTPLYLAPEVITKPASASARSDLYALGVVGYYLLVGEPVFGGESVIEVCGHHLNTIPDPPTRRTENSISPTLERLVLSCLEKEPTNRPANAKTMLDQLQGLPGAAHWTDTDAVAWWRDTRRPTGETWHVDFETPPSSPTGVGAQKSLMIDVHGRNGPG